VLPKIFLFVVTPHCEDKMNSSALRSGWQGEAGEVAR